MVERCVRDAEVAGSNPVASTSLLVSKDQSKLHNDAWLSLVEHYVRDVGVAGSNPVASTEKKVCDRCHRFFVYRQKQEKTKNRNQPEKTVSIRMEGDHIPLHLFVAM